MGKIEKGGEVNLVGEGHPSDIPGRRLDIGMFLAASTLIFPGNRPTHVRDPDGEMPWAWNVLQSVCDV